MKITVIISVSYCYKDIYTIFLNLLNKNWRECPYNIVIISDVIIKGYNIYLKKKNETIPECIRAVKEKENSDFYLFFLGDAFICRKVDQAKLNELLKIMKNKKFDYCSLYNHSHTNRKLYRYLRMNEAYGVQFISFIVTPYFIEKEFNNGVTDFDFEEKYLKLASRSKKELFKNYIVANYKIFSIVHGINKGLWIRKSKRKIKKQIGNDEILHKRKSQTIIKELYGNICEFLPRIINAHSQSKIKQLLSKFGARFYTKY